MPKLLWEREKETRTENNYFLFQPRCFRYHPFGFFPVSLGSAASFFWFFQIAGAGARLPPPASAGQHPLMGLLDRIKSWFSSRPPSAVEKGSPPWSYAGPPGGAYPAAWTDSRHEQVRHFRHWVFVAVTRIAEKVAQQRPVVSSLRIPQETRNAPKNPSTALPKQFPEGTRLRALAPIQNTDDLLPVPANHPLVRLLSTFNPTDTGFDLWYETVMYLKLTGSAYWWLPTNNAGLPTEIWGLPSHWVWPVVDQAGQVSQYRLRPTDGASAGVLIPARDVIHFKTKNPLSKLDGYSPQTAGSQWVDSSESVDRSRWYSFRQGMMQQLAIEFDPMVTLPSEDQLNRIEARLAERYQGEHRSGKPLLVPPGAKLKPLTISPREMDFPGSFEQLRDSILALFGVPAVVAGITKNMTYGAVMGALAGFCTFTINPILTLLGQSISQHLAQRYDPRLVVWWHDCTPEDPQVREQEIRTDVDAGAIMVNELRALRGRPPILGGDVPCNYRGGGGKKPSHRVKPEN
jgi:HK97 family phage portal protein